MMESKKTRSMYTIHRYVSAIPVRYISQHLTDTKNKTHTFTHHPPTQVPRSADRPLPRRLRVADVQPPGEGGLHGLASVGRTSERDLRGVGKAVRALREGSGRHGQEVGFFEIVACSYGISLYRIARSVSTIATQVTTCQGGKVHPFFFCYVPDLRSFALCYY